MGVASGPNIVKDNMVLCWDLESVPKSWAHIPTVNLIGSPTQTWHGAGSEFHQLLDMVQWPHTYGTSVNFSLSFEMRTDSTHGDVSYYMQNGSYTKYSFAGHTFVSTTDWQLFKIEGTNFGGPTSAWVANTPTDHRAMLATYTGYGSGIKPYTRNMQLEVGNYATDFVNGSRSNTAAMVDIVGGGTITANRIDYVAGSAAGSGQGGTGGTAGYLLQTYVVDATNPLGYSFKFDGSNDYISLSGIDCTNTHTIAMWIKPDVATTDFKQLFGQEDVLLFGMFEQSKLRHYSYQSDDLTSNTALTIGSWNHVVLTRSNTTAVFYLNGVADGGGTCGSRTISGTYTVGNRPANTSYQYDGTVGSMHIYDKALSATEVAKNFNAQRSRFGV